MRFTRIMKIIAAGITAAVALSVFPAFPVTADDGWNVSVPQSQPKAQITQNNVKYALWEIDEEGGNVAHVTGCTDNATSVTIPATVSSNGVTYKVTRVRTVDDRSGSFADNTKITSVDMSGATNLKQIHSSCFRDCTSLKTVKMPPNLAMMGEHVFNGCSSLETVSFTGNPTFTYLGQKAFFGKPAVIPQGYLYFGI